MHDKLNVFSPVTWHGSHIHLLDQRLLPRSEQWLQIDSVDAAIEAIRDLVVRGAPAIGITAAYACVLAAQSRAADATSSGWHELWLQDCQRLILARPTAVNLHWAVASMQQCLADAAQADVQAQLQKLQQHAVQIHAQDVAANQRLAVLGAELLQARSRVLTHCNTGALATGGIGTALGVIVQAHRDGKIEQVFADETRPWLQGSRLTEWELQRAEVPCQVIIDSAAAWLMATRNINWLIVGADRITANGDVANKIGTYQAMLVARQHGVKTMVVVPWSTVDINTASGAEVEIELRQADEVLSFQGQRVARAGAQAWNPVFDITPAALVDYLVTERGVIAAPNQQRILALQRGRASATA